MSPPAPRKPLRDKNFSRTGESGHTGHPALDTVAA